MSVSSINPGLTALAIAADEAERTISTGLSGLPEHDLIPHPPVHPRQAGHCRIVLVRHGQPDIDLRPRTHRAGFAAYMQAYEAAGLHPDSAPPDELTAIVEEIRGGLSGIFCSDRPRAFESAVRLLPKGLHHAEALFAEAPLPAPPLPLLRMRVPKWAVLARLFWHGGYHPGIEGPGEARERARSAAAHLAAHAQKRGAAVLVAHGYFNFMIGRALAKRGFKRTGFHRARFWNAVIYDKS